jgi:hypothetical protein
MNVRVKWVVQPTPEVPQRYFTVMLDTLGCAKC